METASLDLVIGNYQGNTWFLPNSGTKNTPVFNVVAADKNMVGIDIGSSIYPSFVAGAGCGVADLDADFDQDMVLFDEAGFCYSIENGGSECVSSFRIPHHELPNVFSESYYLTSGGTLCDLDADGDHDMLMGLENGEIAYFQNRSKQQPLWSLQTTSYFGINVGGNAAPTFCDLDGDRDYDLVVGERYGHLVYFENIGSPSNAAWATAVSNAWNVDVGYDAAPTFFDIDQDGDQDLFVGSELGTIGFYRNTGDSNHPFFQLEAKTFADIDVGWRSCPVFADIDGDGNADLFVSEENGGVNLWRNQTPKLRSCLQHRLVLKAVRWRFPLLMLLWSGSLCVILPAPPWMQPVVIQEDWPWPAARNIRPPMSR